MQKWKITIEMNRWKFKSKDNVENWRKSEFFDFRYFLRSPVFKLNGKSKKSFDSPRKFFSAVEIEREKKQAASWCYYLPFVVYRFRIFFRNYSISLNREWRKIHVRSNNVDDRITRRHLSAVTISQVNSSTRETIAIGIPQGYWRNSKVPLSHSQNNKPAVLPSFLFTRF